MKKTLLIIILLLYCVFGKAQHTDKGRSVLSFSTGIGLSEQDFDNMDMIYSNQKTQSSINTAEKNKFRLHILPEWGYFVSNNVLLGLTSNLDIYNVQSDNDFYKFTGFGVGPLFRYYYPITSILPYLELKGAYNLYQTQYERGGVISPSKRLVLGGAIGTDIPIGRAVAFDISLSYQYYTYMDSDFISSNLSLKLGVCVFLGSKE